MILDTLTNLVAGLFSPKDKLSHDRFGLLCHDRGQLDAAYRGDWIARKIIDVPPFDMTREWRRWHAAPPQIAAIEAEEARLGLQAKVARALRLARLYGGAALVLGAGDADPSQPLPAIDKDGLKYLHVMHRWEITPGQINRDVMSPLFGEPVDYQVSSTGGSVRLHPSRVIRLLGAELPDWTLQGADGWGDSVLQAVMDAVKQAGLATQGVAMLIHEAKLDVIRIPNLSQNLSAAAYSDALVKRFSLANTMKGLVNALVIDKEEEWDRKQISFAQLPEIMQQYLQIAAGAADIPATRLLGQAPAGLNATGEGDIRNYYDRISAEQRVMLTPSLSRLDEALIMSALGARPAEVHFKWAPLWQMSEVEAATVAKTKADASAVYAVNNLIPPAVLAAAVKNQLIEDGAYPGIEAAYADYEAGLLEEPDWQEPDDPTVDPKADPATGRPVGDGGGPNAGRPFVGDKRRGRRGGKGGGGHGHFNPSQPRGPGGRWIETGAARKAAPRQKGHPERSRWPGPKRMRAFVNNALDHPQSKRRAFFGAVSNAPQVHAATGINMAGWKRKMASDEVRKTMERHGNPATEARRSPPQVAVRRSDFKRIRSIVERPDLITKEHLTGSRQLQAVGYQKTIGKVRYHVIEEMQPKRKGASFLTMWKVQL